MENPFRFGTVVEDEYFTDRVQEVKQISQYLNSANHLILISPRRFGKSSVVLKSVKQAKRQYVMLNLQQVTSVSDLASKLLSAFFRIHPWEKVKHLITHFRVIPSMTTNPLTGAVEVTFQPGATPITLLEDVMALLEKAHTEKNRLVVILDEFQEIRTIDKHLDKQLRAIMQMQKHINYVLLGSQESMMTDIFENVRSPFYHFGGLMRLQKLPHEDFSIYLTTRLTPCFKERAKTLAEQILAYTDCHPYYSQQLAAFIWQIGVLEPEVEDVYNAALEQIVQTHGLDYERIWQNFNLTGKWILFRLAKNEKLQTGEYPTSTIYSMLKRLQQMGVVIYSDHYEIEDPFFREWLLRQ